MVLLAVMPENTELGCVTPITEQTSFTTVNRVIVMPPS
jgi:hypothetical protein